MTGNTDQSKAGIYAPVTIITCNRIKHFRECVESLSRCTYADKTELYISVDYPPDESYVEGWKQIKEYVAGIQGFKKVHVRIQEENLGPKANAQFMRDWVYADYNMIISTEDDNVFAPAFLDYMNQMLRRFEKDPKVYAIAGFSMLDVPGSSKIYKNYTFQPWGCGRWKNKWQEIEDLDQVQLCEKFSRNILRVIGLYFRNKWLFCVFVGKLLRGTSHDRLTDAVMTLIFYLSGYYSVFPSKSLVKNNGFDGSGVNCHENEIAALDIAKVEMDEEPFFQYDEAKKVPIIRKWYLPIPEWAKRSARLFDSPLTYALYRIMGRERYLAWRNKKKI